MSRPFRSTFILALTAAATVLAAAGGWRYARASAPASGPIILISVDTLRADHLPAYGYWQVKTPAIDALAADGVVFERAYAHAPLTLPSHATLLTGRLPFETGVRDDGDALNRDRGKGAPGVIDVRLLPQMLRDRGYATAGIVSAYALRAETGIAQGFDFFDGEMPPAPLGRPAIDRRRDGRESEAIAERWLDTSGKSRAFLFLHVNEPHRPYAPPDRYASYAPYDAEIAYTDEIVGRLIRYLKSHQLYDRSTIVLLSDHGEGLGDHGEQAHGLFVYDEAVHVPLVVKQEGNGGAGRRVHDVVQLIDVAPTVLELVKAPGAAGLRGRSLKPLLDGNVRFPPREVYSEALLGRTLFGWSEVTALTDDRYRYIRAPREELYDIGRDPRESANVAAEHDAESRSRRATLEKIGDASRSENVQAPVPDLPDPKDKVRILETYRAAVDLASDRQWLPAVGKLQDIVRDDPGITAIWSQLGSWASLVGRYDLALDAYKHITDLDPSSPSGRLGAAATLVKQQKLRDGATQAAIALGLAADARSTADAHELLARIAAARRDAEAAKAEAALAQQADSKRPLSAFIAGRLLYDQGRFEDAAAAFEAALAAQRESHARIADLHFLAGETFVHVDRARDAEAQLAAEIQDFPEDVRARAALAALYRATDRADAADRTIDEMTRAMPTPESYQLAARLWAQSGNRRKADSVRAEARRVFADAPRGRAARP